MAKKVYIGVNRKARNVKRILVGDENGVAREVIKGYIGDENGKARLFWQYDKYQHLLKQNYEHDETGRFTFGLADVASTVRYALEQMLLKYEGSVYPVFIEQTKAHFNEIVAWCVRHVPEGAQLVVSTLAGYSSTAVDRISWFEVYLDWIENPTLERTVTGSEVINGYEAYYYTDDSPVPWSRINFSIRTTGPNFPSDPVSPGVVPTGIAQGYNFIGSLGGSRTTFRQTVVSNFGCYFTEYELPQSEFYPKYQDYLLYWDFTLTGNKIDYNRNIWLMTENSIQTNPLTGQKYILTTITLPAWIGTHLFADLEIEFWLGGTLSLHNTYNEQTGVITYYDTTLFTYRERYYFDVKRNADNKAYGAWRWFQTDLEEQHEWEDHGIGKFTFNVTYEGKVENDSIDYNYEISAADEIQIGWDRNVYQYPFSLQVYAIGVKRTPINPADLYFYARYRFQHSPEGTDIQYNKIVSESMDDFTEYLGTNKTFILTYQESTAGQVTWQVDNRNFGGYARIYIRSPGTNGHMSRIYVPVNHIVSANGKYMRVSARAFSYTTYLEFGVAYIDGDSLVEETIAPCSLTTSLEKYYGQITSPTVDYMWFEDNGDGRTVMASTVKISDTEDEALH